MPINQRLKRYRDNDKPHNQYQECRAKAYYYFREQQDL
ncbi:conserved hypothetical protein [Marinobacter salarius]|nr:conserved hypothetical protein [Marinobacter salarius]